MAGRRIAAAALAAVAVALLLGLGAWQVERLAWKRALIARVEARLAAPPAPAPGPERWAGIGRDEAYARVAASGRWRTGADTLVQAVTALGPGYWVLTPLDVGGSGGGRGWALLVNRGFVPDDRRGRVPGPPAGPVTVAGLLRLSEPGGGFLRANEPAADRWHSRDVAAIAARRGLGTTAPYFVDAAADGHAGWPRAGLTVVRFPNNHLVYALTWFALAGVVAVLSARALRAGGGA